MPEVAFDVRWPDGSAQHCYSPSRVVGDYLTAGESYALADFLIRSRRALCAASERVREVRGFECTGAREQLAAIEHVAARFDPRSDARVTVEALGP